MKDIDKINNVYTNIRNFRELKNITRDYMAAELDMTVSGYSKIERGEVDISLKKLYHISEILGVEVKQILDFNISHVFNYKDSHVQTHNEKSKMVIYNDAYLEKYVKILEQEVDRLKKGI